MQAKILREMLVKGKVLKVIEELEELLPEEANVLLLLATRHNSIEGQISTGTISYGDAAIERNKITRALLEMIQKLSGSEKKEEPKKNNNNMNFLASKKQAYEGLWNKVRFEDFTPELKTSLRGLIAKIEEYQRSSIGDQLFDVDGKAMEELKAAMSSFDSNHSLEFRKKEKVDVANLVKLVAECENNPSTENAEKLANTLYLYDVQLDYRERLNAVININPRAVSVVLGEMATQVERLWDSVKND